MPCKEDDDRRTKWMEGCIGQVPPPIPPSTPPIMQMEEKGC